MLDVELIVVMSVASEYADTLVSLADSCIVTVNVSVSVFAFGSKNFWSVFAVLAVYRNVNGTPCVSYTPVAT